MLRKACHIAWGSLFAMWLLCQGAGWAMASGPRHLSLDNLSQPVAPGSASTYADLLQLIFPDLTLPERDRAWATAAKTVPLRHIDGDFQDKCLEGSMQFSGVTALPILAQGRQLFLLLLDLSRETQEDENSFVQEHTFLALFDTEYAARLLDVVDVWADRRNLFWTDHPWLDLTAATQAVMIRHDQGEANGRNSAVIRFFL